MIAKLRFTGNRTFFYLVRNTIGTFSIRLAGISLSFAAQAITARFMGSDNYGLFVYALAFTPILAWLTQLGMVQTSIRYISIYNSQKDWAAIKGFMAFASRCTLGASLAIGLTVALIGWLLKDTLDDLHRYVFILAFLHVPFMSLSELRVGVLRGLLKISFAELPENLIRPLLLVILLSAAYFGFQDFVDPVTAMLISLSVAMTNFLLGSAWLRQSLPEGVFGCLPSYRKQEWLNMAVPMFIVVGIQLLISQLDILLIGSMIGTREAGSYAVAARVADFAAFGLVVASSVTAPLIAAHWNNRLIQDLRRLLKITTICNALFVLTAASLIAGIGKYILGIFGASFVDAYPLLLMLLAGRSLHALTGLGTILLTMTGHQKEATWLMGSGLAMQLPLELYLIGEHGAMGAAVASALAIACVNVSALVIVKIRLKLSLIG
ncbi:oligosaccharide flippase family protein [Methylocaldum sp.]|uniref:oligosaccharide flippase family protein n=1 Tax=Methylocaldum sp. TaxID=1969727 RepID=UPI002D3CD897|nr:oligosaccharide flippase family protein [Methylocaldum sp.]HYE35042.1 oligosaccharide flippase family protein [Methylocaldum sp.]